MFDIILVAYDGSDPAKNALQTALGLAKLSGGRVHLAHTAQIDMPPLVVGSYVGTFGAAPTEEEVEAASAEIIAQARQAATQAGIPIADVHLGSQDPASNILEAAQRTQADLIVMGRRGLGSIRSLALGSVSLSVSHGASCACMTVL